MRAFLGRPVLRDLSAEIFTLARIGSSGGSLQSLQQIVTTGDDLDKY